MPSANDTVKQLRIGSPSTTIRPKVLSVSWRMTQLWTVWPIAPRSIEDCSELPWVVWGLTRTAAPAPWAEPVGVMVNVVPDTPVTVAVSIDPSLLTMPMTVPTPMPVVLPTVKDVPPEPTAPPEEVVPSLEVESASKTLKT